MPLTDVTNTLIANITSTEQTTGNVPINRSTGNPAISSDIGQFTIYQKLAAGANNISFPITPITQVYIRNIDPTINITVQWNPAGGGGNVTICTLNPQDQIILFCATAGTNPGITSLVLLASAAGLVEYFLGG